MTEQCVDVIEQRVEAPERALVTLETRLPRPIREVDGRLLAADRRTC